MHQPSMKLEMFYCEIWMLCSLHTNLPFITIILVGRFD